MRRREFLRRAAQMGAALVAAAAHRTAMAQPGEPGAPAPAAPAASAPASPLPMRTLGRTKQKVTILGLGTAPAGEGPAGVEEGIRIFSAVLDRGVNYVDTARIYGTAEESLGHVVPKRRDSLFITTKVSCDTADAAEKSLAESLRLMKTDHVDLVHIHNIGARKLDQVLAKDGALAYLLKQKEAGKTRFIGCSGHSGSANMLRMIQTDQIDVIMCVLNYADRGIYQWESKVLPEARKRGLGVVAMKAYAGIKGGFPNHRRAFVGCATEPKYMPLALAYALDLEGVSLALPGPYTVEQAVQNVEFARQYKPLTADQRDELLAHGKTLAPSLGLRYGPA